ncbi:PIN domain-containing protein [Candidatus Deferrimicrobium sp.]|uniref:PIN domain-containing protein n=1 Tax=Candidatus Deferrimicrobium sp. TaxID=3060586 RepID=UPI003C6F555C
MIRLFLDSNVLFTAAHNPEGKASLVIDLAAAGNWEVVTSAYCLAEARLNVEKKLPAALGRLTGILETVHLVPDVTGERCTLLLPEKDRPVFASAQRCKATHFLTGDRRHFGPYMNIPKDTVGIVVQTVGDFLSDVTK